MADLEARILRQDQLVVIVPILVVLIFASPIYINAQPSSIQSLNGQTLFLRETSNDNRKIYVQVGDRLAFYIHDRSRLFPLRKAEPITILDTQQKADHIEIVFGSQALGKGRIRIYGGNTLEVLKAVIRSAFSETVATAELEFVANKKTGVVHFGGANHLPLSKNGISVSKDEIDAGKFKRCPLCFLKLPRVSSYDLELRLSEGMVGQINMRYPLATDDAIQNRVRRVGQQVLSRWVTAVKGYVYKFFAVESEVLNAWACPAGKIFVTTALLDSLESDDELQAILAHEIAHVELRHGYREFRTSQRASLWVGIALAISAAASRSAEIVNLVNQITQIAVGIVMSGYSRRYEAEADAFASLYLELNQVEDGNLVFRNVMRKLQYFQDYLQPEREGRSVLASHPELDARIDAVENSSVRVFNTDNTFDGYDSLGNLVSTVSFESQRTYKGSLNPDDVGLQIVALVETTSALGDKDRIKDIRVVTSSGAFMMDNKEDTEVLPNDTVGASFVSKSHRELIHSINAIELKLRNVTTWERRKSKEITTSPTILGKEQGTLVVKSTPPGADVRVDGELLGRTPASLGLSAGDHAVSVEMLGFKSWEGKLTLNPAASVTVEANLGASKAISSAITDGQLSRWKAQNTGTIYRLGSDNERMRIEIIESEESLRLGNYSVGEVKKQGNRYVGIIREQFACQTTGTNPIRACTFEYRIELSSVTSKRIEGIMEAPPQEAEFDCSKCSWSRSPIFQHFVWVPE